MCLACLEYIKGNMKLSEYKSALREAVIDGPDEHVDKIQALIYDHEGDEESLASKIKDISGDSN